MKKESTLFPGFFIDAEDNNNTTQTKYPENPVRVAIPNKKSSTYKKLFTSVLEAINKDSLLRLVKRLTEQVKDKSVIYTDKEGKDLQLGTLNARYNIPFTKITTSLNKNSLLEMIMPLLMDFKAFSLWLDTFGSHVKDLWMEALEDFYISEAQLEGYIFYKTRSYINPINSSKPVVTPLLLLAAKTSYYDWRAVAYEIPTQLATLQHKQLSETKTAADYRPKPERIERITTFQDSDIYNHLQSLTYSLTTNPPQYTQKGKITKAYLKSVQRIFNIKPFSDDKNDLWRISIILSTLAAIKNNDTTLNIYTTLLNRFPAISRQETLDIYPGATDILSLSCFDKIVQPAHKLTIEWLKSLPDGQFGSTDELTHILLSNLNLDAARDYRGEIRSGLILRSDFSDNGFAEKKFIFKGIPRGILIYLATFGLVELAFDYIDESLLMDGELFARLTPLGQYAGGLRDDNPINENDTQKKYFEIDSDKRLVTLLEKPNPIESYIATCGIEIHPGEYLITPQKFMADCETAAKLEAKINHFSKFILNDDKSKFNDLFSEMRSRIERTHIAAEGRFAVIQIDPQCTELQNLILNSVEIREISLRVEGYRLLVPCNKINTFHKILRSHGFIPREVYKETYYF